jgi:hypothetical protein
MSQANKKTFSVEQVPNLKQLKDHPVKRCESESNLMYRSLQLSSQKQEIDKGSFDSLQISLNSSDFEYRTTDDFPQTFDLLNDLKLEHECFDPNNKIIMTDFLNFESKSLKANKMKNPEKGEEKKSKVFKPVLAARRINSERKFKPLKESGTSIDKKIKKNVDPGKGKNVKENLNNLGKFAVKMSEKIVDSDPKCEKFEKTIPNEKPEKNETKIKILPPEVIFDHDILDERWKKSVKMIESNELYQQDSVGKESLETSSDKKYVHMSEAGSRNSLGSEDFLEDSLMSIKCKKIIPREPSFGMGGGEFASIEESSKDTHFAENTKDSDKVIQTDSKLANVQELLSMITNKEFINSLKIIGKFANFLERNLQRE